MIIVNSRFLTQKLTGVQRYAIEICLQLKQILDDDVIFVTPCNIIHKNIAQRLDAQIVGTHSGHLWEQWDLPRYLRKHGNPLLLNLSNSAPIVYKTTKIRLLEDISRKELLKWYKAHTINSIMLKITMLMPDIIRIKILEQLKSKLRK